MPKFGGANRSSGTDDLCAAGAARFAADILAPSASLIDAEQNFPDPVLAGICDSGWLGAAIPREWGGAGLEPIEYGPALEHFGAACGSARTLLTVHNMTAQAILRFGNADQKARWLGDLCTGAVLGAFALTEPGSGSDVSNLATTATPCEGGWRVSGEKVWCSFGQIADIYLLFANCEGRAVALIVERASAGLTVEPMQNAFGTRGSMLARLRLDNVVVPAKQRIGAVGAGTNFVANAVLDHGRFSVAWGCVGIIRACLEAASDYAASRIQGGKAIAGHQLVQRQLTDMLVDYTSARALCMRSAEFRASKHAAAASETALAKYHAAEAALRAASQALALHGANGCSPDFPLSRYLRDATVSSIIEGTPEIHQVSLASYALQKPWRYD